MSGVLLPRFAMPLRQPRFLTEDNAQLKGEHDGKRIDQQRAGLKRRCPAQQDQTHRDIHWIAAVSIQTDNNQLARWCPWRKRAFAGHIEIAHTPEQAGTTDCDECKSRWPTQGEARRPRPDHRHDEGHHAGACDEGDERANENTYVLQCLCWAFNASSV